MIESFGKYPSNLVDFMETFETNNRILMTNFELSLSSDNNDNLLLCSIKLTTSAYGKKILFILELLEFVFDKEIVDFVI